MFYSSFPLTFHFRISEPLSLTDIENQDLMCIAKRTFAILNYVQCCLVLLQLYTALKFEHQCNRN